MLSGGQDYVIYPGIGSESAVDSDSGRGQMSLGVEGLHTERRCDRKGEKEKGRWNPSVSAYRQAFAKLSGPMALK